MHIFVVGDVHGCFHTFKELVETHWDSQNEILIQIGDLIDRGLHSGKVVKYFRELQDKYPNRVFALLGNHESECIMHYESGENKNWLKQGGQASVDDFESSNINIDETIGWFKTLPLKWENDFVFCSHAGISLKTEDPYNLYHEESILWTRSVLKNIGKLQIVGHTPMRNGEPFFSEFANALYIDTGAFLRLYLTGVKITSRGEIGRIVKVATHQEDLK